LIQEGDPDGAGDEPRYRLPHDYLVGPIADATRQEVTQSEEARQYLEYYLNQGRVRIPLGRLWFIYRHADRATLRRRDVRQRIRRSVLAHAGRALALVGVLAVANLLLWVAVTAEAVWYRESIHPPREKGVLPTENSLLVWHD